MTQVSPSHRIHIVTDSVAQIGAAEARSWGITVVPSVVLDGDQALREGVDVSHEDAAHRVLDAGVELIAAGASDYAQAYRHLISHGDILSFHPASALSPCFERASSAAQEFRGRSNIRVIDTGTTSVGLRFVVQEAQRLIAAGERVEDVARDSRRIASRVYGVFTTDEARSDFAQWPRMRNLPVRDTGSIPVFALEAGEMVMLERVRSLERAIERIAEFAAEFEVPAAMSIVKADRRSDACVAELSGLLREGIPDMWDAPVETMGASLAKLLGRQALGVVLYDAGES